MRILPAGLQAHLDSGATTLCWCWLLRPRAGAALGFTDHDDDIAFDGVTFEAASGFTGSEIESASGLAVDNLDVAGALRSGRLEAAALGAGHYDHAEVEVWLVNWQDTGQRLLLRKGHLGDVSHGDIGFTAEIRGIAHLFDQPKGRIFGHACDAVLGDARCGVALVPVAGVVQSHEDGRRITITGFGGFAAGWFERGTITFTSGANAGGTMEIKLSAPTGGDGFVELWQPMPLAVAIGDGVALAAGCDKQFATCRGKFANGINFRGFPHMPGNDFVMSYPNRGDAAGGAVIA